MTSGHTELTQSDIDAKFFDVLDSFRVTPISGSVCLEMFLLGTSLVIFVSP